MAAHIHVSFISYRTLPPSHFPLFYNQAQQRTDEMVTIFPPRPPDRISFPASRMQKKVPITFTS